MVLPVKAYQQSLSRPDWTKSTERCERALWLDKNENMDPLYHQQIQTWLQSVPLPAVYGYPDACQLYAKLGAWLNLAPQHLYLAAGSDGVIRSAYEAFVEPGDKVFYTSPTFAMYEIYTKIYGAQAITVDYQASTSGPKLDVERMLHLIREQQPTLVCLPNPDSPTGTVVATEVIKEMLDVASQVGAVVLIDEAYHPFCTQKRHA